MKISNYKVGSDPEVFLKRVDTDEWFPAIGVVKGTKDKPEPMKGLSKGFCWQVDNCSLEFNTPPASTEGEFIINHVKALDFLKKNIPTDLYIDINATAYFDLKYLELPGAMEFGCSSDYNAWTKETNPKPVLEDITQRSAAGHLHIGFDEGADMDTCETLIKVLDLFIAVPSVLIDEDTQRRKLYGKAGCFRFGKSYTGVEFRTPSNFWLRNEETMSWIWNQIKLAVDFINNGNSVEEDALEIQLAINNHDKELTKQLIEKYNLKLPQTYHIYEAAEKQ